MKIVPVSFQMWFSYAAIYVGRLLFWKLTSARCIPLSPPFLTRQIFWDRKQHSFLSCRVEEVADYRTALQVIVGDDYGLTKLRRHTDIAYTYDRIIATGKTPLILDCGGNIGLSSKMFARDFPEAHIVCIEPSTRNVELANRNLSTAKVELVHAAVGAKRSRARLQNLEAAAWAFRTIEDANGDLDVLGIADVLDRYAKIDFTPFYLKLDIEGGESAVFEGDTSWIDDFTVIAIELHDWMLPGQANSRTFLSAIANRDRDFIHVGENIFSVKNSAEGSG